MSDTTGSLPLRVATVADDADRAVLVRIAAGELHALDELYDRYKTMAYSIAFRITNDATLAEDVVQDAFLGAWRNAARYVEGRGSVKTWLLADRPPSRDRCGPPAPPDERAARARGGPPAAIPVAGCLGGGVGQPGCGHGSRRARRPVRVATRGDRARLLRRSHPAGDRRSDVDAARNGQEPDAPGAARDAPRARGGIDMTDDARLRRPDLRRGTRPRRAVRARRAGSR